MSRENVEVVKRCFDLLNKGRVEEAIDTYCHPNVEIRRSVGRLPDLSGKLSGREACKAWFAQLLGTLDIRLEGDEFIDAGDSVVVVFRQIAREPASGAELTSRFSFVYGLHDAKVTYMDGYRTKDEALEAVGCGE